MGPQILILAGAVLIVCGLGWQFWEAKQRSQSTLAKASAASPAGATIGTKHIIPAGTMLRSDLPKGVEF